MVMIKLWHGHFIVKQHILVEGLLYAAAFEMVFLFTLIFYEPYYFYFIAVTDA